MAVGQPVLVMLTAVVAASGVILSLAVAFPLAFL